MDIRISTTLPPSKSDWDRFQPPNSPFLHHTFLEGLSESQCINAGSGWETRYVTLSDDNAIVAVVPMFRRTDSQGEYVFDHNWARFAENNGISYYPKLLVAIPFTPCTGQRILHHADYSLDAICDVLLPTLKSYASEQGCSSLHFLFQTEKEVKVLEKHGFFTRTGTQFHWRNHGFSTFEDFLSSLTSRKRKTIRKEREKLGQSGLDIVRLSGDEISEADMAAMVGFYYETQHHKWGRAYLNKDFFFYLLAHFKAHLVLVLAKDGDTAIAGSLFLKKGNTLYGRYWGASRHVPFLHFELCYYQGIEYCMDKGLEIFEAGAQGEHKLLRGFEPVTTYSSHYMVHPGLHDALSDYCDEERDIIKTNKEYFESIAPNKALKAKRRG